MLDDDLIDPVAAAKPLRRSARTLADWRVARRGPPWYVIEGRVYYRRSEIEAWIATRSVRPDVLRPASVGTLFAA